MPGLRMFKKGFYSHIGANEPIVAGTINLGNTKGRGSSTRMFNYCTERSANPSECINQFITVKSTAASQPAPTPPASWSQLGTGFNSPINSLAIGSDGKVYAAGGFVNQTANPFVSVYNGSTWSQLGTTVFNLAILTLAIGSNGKVYAGGGFENVYVYDPSNSSWTGTTGISNVIYSLVIGSDGKVYAGGSGGSLSIVFVYNGSTWSQLGTTVFNDQIQQLAIGSDGKVYAGGFFTINPLPQPPDYYVAVYS